MTKPLLILLSLLSLFILITLPNLLKQNIVGDEAVYIVEGDRYLHTPYSFYNNSGSPHLLKLLTGIMLYNLPLNRDYTPYFENTSTDVYTVANYIYQQNPQYAKQIITQSRIPHYILAILLAIAIFYFTYKTFNLSAATIALTLYITNATILANAPTANLDIGTTAFIFFTLITFHTLIHAPPAKTEKSKQRQRILMIATAILLGLSQATKISAILLYPFILIYFVYLKHIHKTHYTYRNILFIFLISFISLWAAYGFQFGPIILPTDKPDGVQDLVLQKIPVLSSYVQPITTFLTLPIFPAGAYFNNFTYQFTHEYFGHTVYLNGQFTDHSWWYFIPTLFFIKNPLTFFALAGISLYTMFRLSRKELSKQSFFLIFMAIFILWTLTSSLQLGVRYSMPLFPVLFIWIGVNVTHWLQKNRTSRFAKAPRYLVATTLALYAISTIMYFPNFFAFRNEIVRFRDPVDQLADSDYDWGQNIYLLSDYQQKNSIYPLYFKTFSGASLDYYKVQSSNDAVAAYEQKQKGYYGFSHSALVSLRKYHPDIFAYFSSQKPMTTIGENIYIYHLQ